MFLKLYIRVNWRLWFADKCLITSSLGENKKPWIVAFAGFPGVNTSTKANFSLPMWSPLAHKFKLQAFEHSVPKSWYLPAPGHRCLEGSWKLVPLDSTSKDSDSVCLRRGWRICLLKEFSASTKWKMLRAAFSKRVWWSPSLINVNKSFREKEVFSVQTVRKARASQVQ